MKKPIPKIIDKNNLFDNYILNSYKHNKNSILKSTVKSMDKRYNDYLDNSNKKPKMFEKRMYTRQNSNKLIETLNSTQRNFSNKKLFLSNSYKKREVISKTNETIKNKISVNHTNNFKIDKPESNSNSKKTYTKHKKLLSVQTNINNYKKSYKINQSNIKNPKNNTEVYKQTFNHNKVKDFFSLIDKNKIKNKNSAIHNGAINKPFICGDKILNRSMEQRSKYTIFKLNENMKLKLVKTKNNKKGTEKIQIEKKDTNINNPPLVINNNESYTQRNKPPSSIEICQTFSKEENMKEKEKQKFDNEIINKNENENVESINNSTNIRNEKSIKINTNYKNYNIKNEFLIPKTSTSKDTKAIFIHKEKGKFRPLTSHSMERYTNLKYNAKDNLNNDNNKNITHYSSSVNNKKKKNTYKGPSINKNKNTFTIGNINHNEMIDIKKSINNYSSKANSNTNTTKTNDIFEVISDIKIKSLNEYEEDKKADKDPSTSNSEIDNKPHTTPTETTEINDKTLDKSKVNNNININININYNNININNNNENNNSKNKLNKENNTENNKNKSITVNNKKHASNKNSNNNSNKAIIEKPNLNFNNGVFIEDRDEYNILKETFSKDRFSFRPVNSENNEILTNFQQYNNIVNKNNNINNNKKKNSVNVNKSDKITVGKKEIGKNNIINSSLLKAHMTKNNNNNVNIGNNKEMKKEVSKLQKLKKIIKNKPTTNTLKGGTILNKSVELRFKKLNK